MTPFGIIADDLSGATDTGVQFSRRGARVLVCTDCEDMPFPRYEDWDVVVVNTHSRNMPPRAARREVARAYNWLVHAGWPPLYKKVDSTLRGNLAAELEEMLALGAGRIVLAPAFPLAGRTVEDGILRVNGIPVHETELGRDGLSPVKSAMLRDYFGTAVGPVATLPLAALRREPRGAEDEIQEAWRQGARLLLTDSATQEDLALLARAITSSWGEVVVAGSAGAARELANPLCPGGHPSAPPPTVATGPVLVIAGSRQEATRQQLEVLRKRGRCHAIEVDPTGVRDPWNEELEARLVVDIEKSARLAARSILRAVIISISGAKRQDDPGSAAFQRRSERLNRVLGQVAARLHKALDCPGIIMTGGDVAMAVLSALGTRLLQLGGELLPGVPLAWAHDGTRPGLRLVTKAGGFGPPETLAQAVLALAM
jgi:uncharacterized protein YgbK (DUF1537 family)